MNNRSGLSKELGITGKAQSWDYYAKKYNMTAEAARGVYRRMEKAKVLPIENDFSKLMQKSLAEAAELERLQEIDHHNTVNNYIADLEAKVVEYSENPQKGTASKTVETIEEVQTLDDLVRICKIDTNKWDITRYSQKSSNGKYTVEAYMSKKEISEEEKLKASLLQEVIEYHEKKRLSEQIIDLSEKPDFKLEAKAKARKNQLLELAIFDLHLGKLSWKGETGEDYDMSIAIQRYKDCIAELLSRTDLSKIDRILLPLGNDMIHIDNKFKTTTAGTPQDTDGRFAKIIRVAKRLMIDTIEELSAIAPVDVMIVPGNHDQTVMFTLGEILEAFFYGNEDVTIYNDPKLRKYYKYGQNMIMFTHGSEEKHADLGLIAATEAPSIWANTKYREVHLGHLHKSKSVKYTNVDEYQGFKIRIINSLSGTDAWHYSKGYMSLKGAEAFIWDAEKGLITNHFYNL